MPAGREPSTGRTPPRLTDYTRPAQPELSPDQWEAVRHTTGPIRIVAGPGTGKTRVIVERIAHLIESGVAKPENILALTFSRKAAGEMRVRLAERLHVSYSSLAVSTFHGFCLSAVTDYYQLLDYRSRPTLLVSTEQWLLVKDLLKAQSPANWPHYGGVLTKAGFVQEVFDFILRAQESLRTAEELRALAAGGREDWLEIVDFYEQYLHHLHENALVDYGGVIVQAVRLLASGSPAADEYRRRFHFILVDEYQDTNYAQEVLLSRLQEGHGNLCVVGDDDQAIHGFRGATVENILHFDQRYGGRTVELRTNYRSCSGIVEVSRTVIERNTYRLPKGPALAAKDEAGLPTGAVEGRTFKHYAGEAGWVAGTIMDLLGAGKRYGDIAVLFRSVKSPLAQLIYDELRSSGVPCRLSGATGQLYSHPLVRAALELMAAVQAGQVPLSQMASLLQSDFAQVSPFAVRLLCREASRRRAGLQEYLQSGCPGSAADAAEREKATAFAGCLQELSNQRPAGPAELAFAIWRTFPLFKDLCLSTGGAYAGEIARREALANISRFVEDVKRVAERRPGTTVEEYLGMVEAGRFADVPEADPVDEQADLVNIMTVHQAKGLEWDTVFLPGLTEGVFPLAHSRREIADPLLLHRTAAGPIPVVHHYEEERRLFYVGLTRAKRKCYLSCSEASGPTVETSTASRFLKEAMACPQAAMAGEEKTEAVRPLTAGEAESFFRRNLQSPDPLVQAQSVHALLQMKNVAPAEWWVNTAPTVCRRHPFPEGRLALSASQLSTYRECPLKYKFQSFWRLSAPEGPYLSRGTFVHSILEAYHNPATPRPRTWDSMLALLDKHWRDDAFPFKPVAVQARRQAEAELRKYYEWYGDCQGVLAVEVRFSFPFDGHDIRGRIDRVDRLPGGKLEIIDYKTGDAMPARDAGRDLQLALYDLALGQCPELSGLGAVARVSYLYLKEIGVRADGKRSYAPTPETRQQLAGRVRRCARGILDELFPSHACIEETWGDVLDDEERDWIRRRDPCRVCGWTWLCPEQGGG